MIDTRQLKGYTEGLLDNKGYIYTDIGETGNGTQMKPVDNNKTQCIMGTGVLIKQTETQSNMASSVLEAPAKTCYSVVLHSILTPCSAHRLYRVNVISIGF